MVSLNVHYPRFNGINHATRGILYNLKEHVPFTTLVLVLKDGEQKEERAFLWRHVQLFS